MKMKTTTIDKWIWVLIYVGLGAVGLGLALQRQNAAFGPWVAGLGAAAIVIGALLIFIRSRINDTD